MQRQLLIKGTGSRDIYKSNVWTKMNSSIENKNLSWFLNFQSAPLMRCRRCHFPHGFGENVLENLDLLEIYLSLRSSMFPVGSLLHTWLLLVHWSSSDVFFKIAKRTFEVSRRSGRCTLDHLKLSLKLELATHRRSGLRRGCVAVLAEVGNASSGKLSIATAAGDNCLGKTYSLVDSQNNYWIF
jgi:hypothetical protein